jgi:type IV pilus assembly protein PilE
MNSRNPLKTANGFSLIELMIVVALVGILLTIVVPSYQDYIRRGKIGEATSELAAFRARQEQFFQDNRTYASGGTTCGGTLPGGTKYFTYTCNAATATTYTATATGIAGQGMNGFTFTIDQNNTRQTTAFPGVSGTMNCWIYKKDESC